jgi:hypothetical protein
MTEHHGRADEHDDRTRDEPDGSYTDSDVPSDR